MSAVVIVTHGFAASCPGREGRLPPLPDQFATPTIDGRRFDDAQLIGVVIDDEVSLKAESMDMLPEDPRAGRVKGTRPQGFAIRAQQLPQANAHLFGSLVGEGDSQDLRGAHASMEDQVGNAVGEHTGLPAARSCKNQQRSPLVLNGFPLLRIEVFLQP